MVRAIEPLIPALRRYARALLANRADADDLVQDCLERAVSRWHQRRPDSEPRPWLFAILHNLAMTRLRRASSRPRSASIDETGELEFARPATQEDALRHAELLRALAQLPEDQRAVLLLVAVEELSYAEAATALDIPIGTVMSRLSRARARLHTLLSAEPARAPVSPPLRRVK
ncbi:sigma-70 family RNA polymerase sigma factor [Ancylobacter pratisalsi]|uniref:Sigma-70 family RNA polymerase sigma factor n=2 Tax=Ancylobacter pratisalsi TaxID=1745854 RepID=A0A6P1YTZ9_9HYPH|nr:sigma-70 family RNA polymerase sigma factor [Ancylobacter pratisalsi]